MLPGMVRLELVMELVMELLVVQHVVVEMRPVRASNRKKALEAAEHEKGPAIPAIMATMKRPRGGGDDVVPPISSIMLPLQVTVTVTVTVVPNHLLLLVLLLVPVLARDN